MSSAKLCVDEQLNALKGICDLEKDVLSAFSDVMLPIAERYLSASTGSVASGDKIKITKKTAGKTRTTKPKAEGAIPKKNPYHFYVAAQMSTVKAMNIGAKQRMSKIGEMWKATSVDDRSQYKAAADSYNNSIAEATKVDGWLANRDAVIAAANATAHKELTNVTAPVDASASDDVADAVEQEEAEEEEEVVEVPVVVAAPVVVATAPATTVKRKAAKKQ